MYRMQIMWTVRHIGQWWPVTFLWRLWPWIPHVLSEPALVWTSRGKLELSLVYQRVLRREETGRYAVMLQTLYFIQFNQTSEIGCEKGSENARGRILKRKQKLWLPLIRSDQREGIKSSMRYVKDIGRGPYQTTIKLYKLSRWETIEGSEASMGFLSLTILLSKTLGLSI